MTRLYFFILFLTLSCQEKQSYRFTGSTMGTSYTVLVESEEDMEFLKKDIDSFLKSYNQVFSTYIENSELSLVNKAELNKPIKVSQELYRVLRMSREIFERSEGYFDITVGPLVNRWGFGPVQKMGKPSERELTQLKEKVGFNFIDLGESELVKKKDIYIDLSAIAKGDGVDQLAKLLSQKYKLKDFFIEIGGEVFTKGKKKEGRAWRVGIEKPSQEGQSLQKIVELQNEGIATSGSYRNYIKYGDSIFSHMIDPKTAYPVKHKTVSVSVISSSCAKSDAWATAFMSMGVKKSLDIAKKEGLKALFLVKENGKIKEYKTANF